jgi:hypothetical protein
MSHSIRQFNETSSHTLYERTGAACKWSRYSIVERNGKKLIRCEGPGIDRLYEPTQTVLIVVATLCMANRNDEGVTIGEAGEKLIQRYLKWKAQHPQKGQAA